MKLVPVACAIYTRKSSEEGLEQSFNSLDAQREACAAFIVSQKTQGWHALPASYDDGGYSGGNVERPGLKRLLADVDARRVRVVVVYKVDRLTRSLADFAKLVERFDAHDVSFVSVTQQFNTTSSMGRLTLNVLLSFAQFEREVTGERIRDKIAASKRKGLWMGGIPPIGYRGHERTLVVDEPRAMQVREIYALYRALGCVRRVKETLAARGWVTAPRMTRRGSSVGSRPFSRGHLYRILSNPIYLGQIAHKGAVFPGQHPPIVDAPTGNAVQAQLAANRQGRRNRANCRDPSLLAELVFDAQGKRLTPTHAKKGSKRYRYYVSHALVQASAHAAEDALRVPAHELEGAVIHGLVTFLTDRTRLLPFLETRDAKAVADVLHRAQRFAEQLRAADTAADVTALFRINATTNGISIGEPPGAAPMGLMRRLVERITVSATQLQIIARLDALGIESAVACDSDDDHGRDAGESTPTTTLTLPIQLKRCGMAMRLIVHARGEQQHRSPDPTLVALLTKANQWFARLTAGESTSILSIAQREQVLLAGLSKRVILVVGADLRASRLTA